ncbi:putative amidase PB8B6.03 [Favolaschia claudopus]|uniref:amidase n=1 Tax=Favolaschia claudopus TaxID=2862362 RepID=A0AAW0BCM3_9AGAR
MWPFSSTWSSDFKSLVQAKQGARAQALAAASEFKPDEHNKYLQASASQIVDRIGQGEWTATQVVTAYIARAVVAHNITNGVTEVLFSEALRQAQELDVEYASTRTLRGPLHGVPLSVKVQNLRASMINGYDSSMGFSQRIGKPATSDSDVVALLKAAGAIPIVKTNVPQTMFTFECCNPVFGRSVNPYNSSFTCGGSSGGEAALLAMNGSALSIGSDVGGSLRLPSSMCGVYSLKPSPWRVSSVGSGITVPGSEGIVSVAGPMGRCVEDLKMWCRVVFGTQGRSNVVAPIQFREPQLPQKLRFDGYVRASPANKRAISETVTALRRQGHECVEILVPDPIEAFNVYVGITSADAYKTLLSNIGQDPLDSSLLVVAYGNAVPRLLRNLISWAISFFLQDDRTASLIKSTGAKTVREYLQWVARRDKYNAQFYEEVWNKQKLDGIIAPVMAIPQVPNGSFRTVFAIASATALYNLVNSPSGCIPVTKVDPIQDALTAEWSNLPSPSLLERLLYQGKRPIYDPVAMQGMPVGIQVVGKRWEDEKVLGMMEVIDTALGKGRGFGPGSFIGA